MQQVLADEGVLTVGIWQLEYRMIGPRPAEAPTLVLLHEGLGSVSTWKDFPDQLAARTNCGVFVYSRRGYGGSSRYPDPWPLTYMHEEARDILPRVLDEIGFERGLLVGHSDGASISAIYAGGCNDDRVAGLVLIAPHFFTEDSGLTHIAMAAEAYEHGGLREKLLAHHGDNTDDAFWGWNNAWLHPGFKEWNIENHLPRITVPVLVIQGADDQYGSELQIEAAKRGVNGPFSQCLLDQCTHFPHREQPAATLDVVSDFAAQQLIGAAL